MGSGEFDQGVEEQRGLRRDRLVVLPALAVIVVAASLFDSYRRGVAAGVVALSLCLTISITLAVVTPRFRIRWTRLRRFAAVVPLFAAYFWTVAIGVDDSSLLDLAVVAVWFGVAMGAWHLWTFARRSPRSDHFVTMGSASSPPASARQRSGRRIGS